LAALGFYILSGELDEFPPVSLLDADLHFGSHFVDFAAANCFPRFQLSESLGNDFALRKVSARLHRFFDKLLVFLFERNGDSSHSPHLNRWMTGKQEVARSPILPILHVKIRVDALPASHHPYPQ
jgi:hypothetical protein